MWPSSSSHSVYQTPNPRDRHLLLLDSIDDWDIAEEEDELQEHSSQSTLHSSSQRTAVTASPSPARKSKTWTQEEDELLTRLVVEERKGWQAISNLLKAELNSNKNADQCCGRWKKVLDPKVKKGPWTAGEDALLVQRFEVYGDKWSKIAESIPNRTGKQVRDRFLNYVNPQLRKDDWSQEEVELFLQTLSRVDNVKNKWVAMSGYLKGRSPRACANFFHTYVKDKNSEQVWNAYQEQHALAKCTPSSARQSPERLLRSSSSLSESSSSSSITADRTEVHLNDQSRKRQHLVTTTMMTGKRLKPTAEHMSLPGPRGALDDSSTGVDLYAGPGIDDVPHLGMSAAEIVVDDNPPLAGFSTLEYPSHLRSGNRPLSPTASPHPFGPAIIPCVHSTGIVNGHMGYGQGSSHGAELGKPRERLGSIDSNASMYVSFPTFLSLTPPPFDEQLSSARTEATRSQILMAPEDQENYDVNLNPLNVAEKMSYMHAVEIVELHLLQTFGQNRVRAMPGSNHE